MFFVSLFGRSSNSIRSGFTFQVIFQSGHLLADFLFNAGIISHAILVAQLFFGFLLFADGDNFTLGIISYFRLNRIKRYTQDFAVGIESSSTDGHICLEFAVRIVSSVRSGTSGDGTQSGFYGGSATAGQHQQGQSQSNDFFHL